MAYCLSNQVCFQLSCREEADLVKEVARRLGFEAFKVDELAKGEEAFFIGPFGTVIFGRIGEKSGPVSVWRGFDNNRSARYCTITSAIYRRIPRELLDAYLLWARRWCPWPRGRY